MRSLFYLPYGSVFNTRTYNTFRNDTCQFFFYKFKFLAGNMNINQEELLCLRSFIEIFFGDLNLIDIQTYFSEIKSL